MSGPFLISIGQQRLEDELQSQLDGAGAARAENGIEGCYVRSGTSAAERAGRRICRSPTAVTIGAAPRIGKVRVVENIETLSTELRPDPFRKFEFLSDGENKVVEACVTEDVAAHVPESVGRIRNHKGFAIQASVAATRSSLNS